MRARDMLLRVNLLDVLAAIMDSDPLYWYSEYIGRHRRSRSVPLGTEWPVPPRYVITSTFLVLVLV